MYMLLCKTNGNGESLGSKDLPFPRVLCSNIYLQHFWFSRYYKYQNIFLSFWGSYCIRSYSNTVVYCSTLIISYLLLKHCTGRFPLFYRQLYATCCVELGSLGIIFFWRVAVMQTRGCRKSRSLLFPIRTCMRCWRRSYSTELVCTT